MASLELGPDTFGDATVDAKIVRRQPGSARRAST
jgi:hypothetical protein